MSEVRSPKSVVRSIGSVEKMFRVSVGEMRKIAGDFRAEMDRGLSGRKGSLTMILTYARKPTGSEKG